MRTSNPVLNDKSFEQFDHLTNRSTTMTIGGTSLKALMLLLLCAASAFATWYVVTPAQGGRPELMMPLMIGGLIGGLIFALITSFVPKVAPFTAPMYALAEGLFLAAISILFDSMYPGIVNQAVALTFGCMLVMLTGYMSGVLRFNQTVRTIILVATGAVGMVYLVSIVSSMIFGASVVGFLHEATPLGIAFSVFVVGLAAFNLVLDFEFIEKGSQSNAPKYMEWVGAFGLMVTLVWLYIEILRLLSKLRDR